MAILILHNMRSAHNVGSMFRTADAAGIERVYLTGYTPGPTDPRGKVRTPFVKVSLGAEHMIPHSMHKQLSPVVKKLKKQGYTIVGVEQHERANNLFTYKPKTKKLAVVMGNEVRGLSPQAVQSCDVLVEIPMHGKKESLNVSVACGIALFALIR
jgi:23S rRNA (guanosine2251-2'-O)-methyltransferase